MWFPLEYYAYSGLLNFVAFSALAIVVLLKQFESKTGWVFSVFSELVAVWSLFYFFWLRTSNNPDQAEFLVRTCMIPVAFLPAVFLSFSSMLTGWRIHPVVHGLNYFLSCLTSFIVYTPLFATGVGPHLVFPYWPIPGLAFPIHIMHTMGGVLFGLWLVYRKAKESTGHFRNQLLWVFWGLLIAFLSGCTNYLCWYRVPFPPVFNFIVPIYVAAVAYAIIRHQFLDIRIVIRKSLVYSGLVACITATYLVMVLVMEKWFQGFFGYRSLLASLIAAFLIAMFFNPLRNRIQTLVDRALFNATPPELAAQREQLLVEIRKGDQMKAIAVLAAGMAHEIKNPLASLKTFTDYLPSRGTDPDFQKKFHRVVNQEVGKIDRIVHRLLDCSKPTPPQLELIRISQVLDETLDFLSGECVKRRIVVKRLYAPQDLIHADPQQLRQAFLNLFLNSLEAMDGYGGTLSVATAQQNGLLTITIEDTGPGIPKEHLSQIFEPFFTTKPTGTGLGLSIVSTILQEHGGRIDVENVNGHGARCILTFPIVTMPRNLVLP